MPGGDRTGPLGFGPRTGRALGYCSGSQFPGYVSGWRGRSLGYGRGVGRFGGWGYVPPAHLPAYRSEPKDQLTALRAQADELRAALDDVERRLSEAEAE